MNKKVISYLGFAKKAGKLVSGVGTCTFELSKGRVKLMILAEDISENSEKKIMKEIRRANVPYIKYGTIDEMSMAIGANDRSVFGICDKGFAEVISKEASTESK